LDYTFKAERKIEIKWSAPRRIVSRKRNSYALETLEGLPISGRFSSRRLRHFIPRSGTALAEAQLAVEVELGIAEEEGDKPDEEQSSDGESGRESDTDEEDSGEVEGRNEDVAI
jgi:hypothetical protein